MQRRDQLGGVALNRRRDAPAVGLDEIHGEEIGQSDMHGRHRQRRVAGKLAEHIGLKAEIGARASLERLDRKPPSIGEINLVSGKPKADRHRGERGHFDAERRLQSVLHRHAAKPHPLTTSGVFCHMPETKSP